MHAAIVLFWGFLFLLPYVATRVIPGKYQPAFLLRPFLTLDFNFADTLARHGRRTPPNPDIVFLGIDDASNSLDGLNPEVVKSNHVLTLMKQRWPWPREIYADLLDRLCDSGAKVVILDVLFAATTPDDPLLKASLDRHADKVVLSCNFLDSGERLTLPSSSLIAQTLPLDSRTAFVNFGRMSTK